MAKIGFVLSFILSEIGCACFFVTVIFEETIPVIGKMASQLSETQRYGELMYLTSYTKAYIFSILMIVIGIILSLFFYRRG